MLIWVLIIWQVIQPKQTKLKKSSDGIPDIIATKKYCILLFIVPVVIISLRTEFGDTGSYIRKFNEMLTDWNDFSTVVKKDTKAQLFVGVEFLFKTFISKNAQIFLAFLALMQSWLMLRTFKKYSPDIGMSVFMFVASALIISWMGNGVRQGIAVMICFACTELLLKKKYVPYYAVLLLTMGLTPLANRFGLGTPVWFLGGIHQSTLIMILASVCIIGKPFNLKVWLAGAALVVLIFTNSLDDLLEDAVENTTYVNDLIYAQQDNGTSLIRVTVAMVPMAMALFAMKEIKKPTTPPVIVLAANASVITSILYIASAFTSGIYVGRLPVYTEMYNLILVPWLVRHAYKKEQRILTIAFIGFYTVYFFYQVSIQWKGLFQIGILS